jgi:hypothetical protein
VYFLSSLELINGKRKANGIRPIIRKTEIWTRPWIFLDKQLNPCIFRRIYLMKIVYNPTRSAAPAWSFAAKKDGSPPKNIGPGPGHYQHA